MKGAIPVISLIGALVALAGSAVSFITSYNNTKETAAQATQLATHEEELAEHQKAIDALKKNTTVVFRSLTIDVPNEGTTISEGVYNDMRGTFAGEIPEEYRLWVLARDQFNFFLMYPPTQLTRTMGRWSQTNVRLNTPGRWELHVCLANSKASDWFQSRADRNDWSGFSKLPDGAETVRYVVVEKK